ncbi:hypothetical protein RSK20926_15526 [Roseobacter sp. SK209-2-6]|uniref:hypothetical protein n=1 Tax=Roseobacter sp. SK209-2-6 TaxID=388739 RepID=UPI0000F3EEE1|nr:hypothetical protein [Roseobacter sp. SK209-2-6]EBA15641.1 hypothetical protein RSK20926_15526 [Roseobacter sp. SK209-2-6]
MQELVKRSLAGVVLGLVLVGADQARAGAFMTAEEMLEVIPGASLTGISNEDFETRWVQRYERGERSGIAQGRFGERSYASRWSVRRDLWCEDWGSGSGCWRLKRIDGATLQPYRGSEKLPNAWMILHPAESQE